MGEVVSGDFDLTIDELRCVAAFVVGSARPLLVRFEDEIPDDDRPRAALDAAQRFVDGERRTRLQRVASIEAHRAAAAAPTEIARLSAQAAGDAASAAYLHPIGKAHQVGHVLRAAANAARIAELEDGAAAAGRSLRAAVARASPVLVDVLRRYPAAPGGRSRAAVLMSELDAALRRT